MYAFYLLSKRYWTVCSIPFLSEHTPEDKSALFEDLLNFSFNRATASRSGQCKKMFFAKEISLCVSYYESRFYLAVFYPVYYRKSQ